MQTIIYGTKNLQCCQTKAVPRGDDFDNSELPNPPFTRPIGLLLKCLPRAMIWCRYLTKIGLLWQDKTAATLIPVLMTFPNAIFDIHSKKHRGWNIFLSWVSIYLILSDFDMSIFWYLNNFIFQHHNTRLILACRPICAFMNKFICLLDLG